MRQRLRTLGVVGALFAGSLSPSITLAGEPPRGSASTIQSKIAVEAVPLFGVGTSIPWGWNGMVVRIQNNDEKPARGEVRVSSRQYSRDGHTFVSTAPFNAAAGSSVHIRMPVDVALYGELVAEVLNEAGAEISSTRFSSIQPTGVLLLDVSETSRLRGAINDAPISPLFTPTSMYSRGSGSGGPTLSVATPRFDPATGDPLLPDRAALYASADAVLMRSEVLTRLSGPELDSLVGYVLGGGTLAVAVSRPEDIRHPTLTAFAGGPITKTAVSSIALHDLTIPMPTSGLSSSTKIIPNAARPSDTVAETLAGFAGGNLHGSPYGNSAFYGLGELHMLAFDPTQKPAVDDPWVQIRMIDLARRAYDRRSTQVFRPGGEDSSPNHTHLRQQLDPNQSSRWAIGIAALLLCVYAVIAGPVNFSTSARKGKPLRALVNLPILAAITFALVVAIGIAAKGVTGRARHITLVEAGAGMSKGTARRWRGFFASRAKELTVRTTDTSSVVSTAIVAKSADHKDHLIVDRDGARLVEVAALPWQTIVVREDGFASIGDGISIVKEADGGVSVTNRTGHNLRALVLRLPNGTTVYSPMLKDGDKLASSSAAPVSSLHDGSLWESQVSSTSVRAGSLDLHRLQASSMQPWLEDDAPGLSTAWSALEDAAGDSVDWFPDGIPVLLAQLDGGEGKTSDSGLRLESDRLLVRIVGFGGNP